jgi:GNAT superfamily N-acetyltransferase
VRLRGLEAPSPSAPSETAPEYAITRADALLELVPITGLDATSAAGPVGECGLEIAHLSADGLSDGTGVRPRAILSGTLFVHSRFRRQKIAQRLLREAETQARWWGCGELLLMVSAGNAPARRLYEKMGYVAQPRKSGHGAQICMSRQVRQPPSNLRPWPRCRDEGRPVMANPLDLDVT